MCKQLIAIMIIASLMACRNWTWRGVDRPLKCADSNGDELHCVGGGRSYVCIRDVDAATMDCAPMPVAWGRP